MKSIASALFTVCVFFAGSSTAQTKQQPKPTSGSTQKPFVEYLNPGGGQNYPFSDAVRVGDWLILSGRIGTDSSGKLVSGGIQAETKQTMEAIGAVL